MEWSLPPEIPWPQFLRMLRHSAPPRGWLEAAAELEEIRRRPLLLRWIAQHRKAPESLRVRLLLRLPWRALASVAEDPSAHPKARSMAAERLQVLWGGMSLGERRAFAYRAPRAMWAQVWKIRDAGVIHAFLQHPRLAAETLAGLIQPPLLSGHMDALARSKWRDLEPIAQQVLLAMDRTLQLPDCTVVLGQAVPWIKALGEEARIVAAARLTHPPLRRMTRMPARSGPSEDLLLDLREDLRKGLGEGPGECPGEGLGEGLDLDITLDPQPEAQPEAHSEAQPPAPT